MNNITIQRNDFEKEISTVFDFLDVHENTRKEYKSRIKLFLLFLESHEFDTNTFLEFKRYLKSRTDFTASTKNKYLATARIFLKELNRRGYILVDITQNIKSFKQSHKHKREGLNQAEIELLVKRIYNLPRTKKTARTKALFCLLALQGMRQIEIIRLDVLGAVYIKAVGGSTRHAKLFLKYLELL